jgi:hypothetical protein
MTNLKLRRSTARLLIATSVVLSLAADQSARSQNSPGPAQDAGALYTPVQSEILVEYHRDSNNKKVQTWRQYWSWVQTFYKGNLVSAGWARFSEVTLEAVKSDEGRRQVVQQLNEVGKLIGREWAKDGAIRKISTADLRRWNDAINDARRRDNGSGQRILDAIKTIRQIAAGQLKSRLIESTVIG